MYPNQKNTVGLLHICVDVFVAMAQLCEFIEDCDFPMLAVRIIHLLGCQGPRSENPGAVIRHIYNRIILEGATVRAAAVSALARFGLILPDWRSRISSLLQGLNADLKGCAELYQMSGRC